MRRQPGADRQWLAVYDPQGTPHDSAYTGPTPLVYLEYNNLTGPGPGPGQTGKVFQAAGSPNPDGTYNLLLNIGTPGRVRR